MAELNEKILILNEQLEEHKELVIREKNLCDQSEQLIQQLHLLSKETDELNHLIEQTNAKSNLFFLRRFMKHTEKTTEELHARYYACVKQFNAKQEELKNKEEEISEVAARLAQFSEIEESLKKLLIQKEFSVKNTKSEVATKITLLAESVLHNQAKIARLNQEKLELNPLSLEIKSIRKIITDIIDQGRIEYGGKGNSNSYNKNKAIETLITLGHALSDGFELSKDLEGFQSQTLKNIKNYTLKLLNFTSIFAENNVSDMIIRRSIAEIHDATQQLVAEVNQLVMYIDNEASRLKSQSEKANEEKLKCILQVVMQEQHDSNDNN